MNDIAIPIAEHLNLDVARCCDVFFNQDAGRTKCCCGLANRAVERIIKGGVAVDTAYASAAAAGRRFYQDWIADLVRLLLEELPVLPLAVITGHDRDAGFFHQCLGAIFQPHRAHGCRRGSYKRDPGLRARIREIAAFGQEPVARVNAFRARKLCHFDQPVDREIALARFRGADEVGLIAKPSMQRVGVRCRINGDRPQPKPFGGARYAAGDFAAIGNED